MPQHQQQQQQNMHKIPWKKGNIQRYKKDKGDGWWSTASIKFFEMYPIIPYIYGFLSKLLSFHHCVFIIKCENL